MSGKGEKKKGVEERLRVKTVGAHIESGSQKRAKRDKQISFDNGADSDDSSDDRMSLSSVYSNASRPCSTLVNVSDSECALVNLDCNQSSDPGLWLLPFSSELVDFWIEKGPIACQNNDGAFLKSKRVYNAKGKKTRFLHGLNFHKLDLTLHIKEKKERVVMKSLGKKE
ncbi:hypothetical protein DAPPUDRAFT_329927 [Daphnia pulex]|uniref:Uncharacterized protein n=1 Tax=Daphnia pulex TaxID=6669 RepID=E9HI12_DAPPU|nr:hypothetical protein DAPPUDRAFT_329927 [Daphnia pulex]|eukprot:EFX68646.1 hypothetical protein DAPPUDRAFT_329927 [Daphnia pulex]